MPDALALAVRAGPRAVRGLRLGARRLRRPRGRRPARLAGGGRGRRRRPGADHDRRPRHVPVRRRARERRSTSSRARAASTRSTRRRCASATGSGPSWSRTSSRCAAIRPTGCPARPGSAPKTAADAAGRATARWRARSPSRRAGAPAGRRRPDARAPTSCGPSGTSRRCAPPRSSCPPTARPTSTAGREAARRLRDEPAGRAAREADRCVAGRTCSCAGRLGRELDRDHVAVGDHVVAALEPQRAAVARARRSRRRRAAASQRTTSARTKPRWMSEWIRPAACHTDRPRRRCQDWAGLSSPAVKNVTRSSSEKAPRTTRLQARLGQAEVGAHRRRVLVGRARPARPPAGRRRRPPRRPAAAACSAIAGRDLVGALLDVGDEQDRLGGQRLRAGSWRRARRRAAARCARAGRPAAPRSARSQPGGLGDGVAVAALGGLAPRARAGARPARGRRRPARSRSSRCRRSGSTRPSGWTTLSVVVGADHVHDRVGLADVGEELVAEALARGERRRRARRCRERRSCRARPWRRARPRRRVSRRSSATGTIATLGSIVVNG